MRDLRAGWVRSENGENGTTETLRARRMRNADEQINLIEHRRRGGGEERGARIRARRIVFWEPL
jgi:hypothetical protein